jgi:hypothetical protein
MQYWIEDRALFAVMGTEFKLLTLTERMLGILLALSMSCAAKPHQAISNPAVE